MANKINKVVIFAGGRGTRMSEYTEDMPKPLVLVNDEPVILHVMRHFYRQGYNEFILTLGYKSDYFKRYFRDYHFHNRNVSLTPSGLEVRESDTAEKWTVHLVDTGVEATTGQRLDAVRSYIGEDNFFLTYGDGLSNVDLTRVEESLMKSNNLATVTAVPIAERFGVLDIDGSGCVRRFAEKSDNKSSLINGGFIACRNGLLDYVSKDAGDFSFDGLTRVAEFGKLGYYLHEGFWKAMDTKKDVDELNQIFKDRPELIVR